MGPSTAKCFIAEGYRREGWGGGRQADWRERKHRQKKEKKKTLAWAVLPIPSLHSTLYHQTQLYSYQEVRHYVTTIHTRIFLRLLFFLPSFSFSFFFRPLCFSHADATPRKYLLPRTYPLPSSSTYITSIICTSRYTSIAYIPYTNDSQLAMEPPLFFFFFIWYMYTYLPL